MCTVMVTSPMTTAEKLFHSLFSPPRPIHESKDHEPEDEDHNKNSAETGISSRCQFTFSDGRQCRNESASLCRHHSSRKQRESAREISLTLRSKARRLCGDLTNATNINRALSHVFLLMAQGRISQKQAVAFGYITQLLLQTVPGIRSEYVSVHGYRDWEAKLKIDDAELKSTHAFSGGENRTHVEAADRPTRMVVPSEQRERGFSRLWRSFASLSRHDGRQVADPTRIGVPSEQRERGNSLRTASNSRLRRPLPPFS